MKKYEDSIHIYEKILTSAEEIKNNNLILFSIKKIVLCYLNMNDELEAIKWNKKLLELAQNFEDKTIEIEVFNIIEIF